MRFGTSRRVAMTPGPSCQSRLRVNMKIRPGLLFHGGSQDLYISCTPFFVLEISFLYLWKRGTPPYYVLFSICFKGPPFPRYSCLKAERLGPPQAKNIHRWTILTHAHLLASRVSLSEKCQLPSPKGFEVIGDQNLDWGYFFTVALKLCTLPVPSVLVLVISFLYRWKRGTPLYHRLFSVCFDRPPFLRYSHLKLNALGLFQAKNIYHWTIWRYADSLAPEDLPFCQISAS